MTAAGRWFCKNDPSAFLGCYDDGAFLFFQSSFSFTKQPWCSVLLLPRTRRHLVNEASTMKHGHMERVEPDLTSAGATHNGRYKYSKELNRKSPPCGAPRSCCTPGRVWMISPFVYTQVEELPWFIWQRQPMDPISVSQSR